MGFACGSGQDATCFHRPVRRRRSLPVPMRLITAWPAASSARTSTSSTQCRAPSVRRCGSCLPHTGGTCMAASLCRGLPRPARSQSSHVLRHAPVLLAEAGTVWVNCYNVGGVVATLLAQLTLLQEVAKQIRSAPAGKLLLRAPANPAAFFLPPQVYDSAVPFGGYKSSGIGRDKGECESRSSCAPRKQSVVECA